MCVLYLCIVGEVWEYIDCLELLLGRDVLKSFDCHWNAVHSVLWTTCDCSNFIDPVIEAGRV